MAAWSPSATRTSSRPDAQMRPRLDLVLRVDDPAAPRLAGRYSLDRYQGSEITSAHMFNVIPGIDHRDLLVASTPAGPPSSTSPIRPSRGGRLLRRGRSNARGDQWASYWYRGYIWASDHLRGLDVFALDLPDVGGATSLPHLNPQTRESPQ